MTATCPSCGCEQGAGLLCSSETDRLERELGDVAAIVADLDLSLSKQAQIGAPNVGGGMRKGETKHEGLILNVGAIDPRWVLSNVLSTWAMDVSGEKWHPQHAEIRVYRNPQSPLRGPFCADCRHPSCAAMRLRLYRPATPVEQQAAAFLLSSIPTIRRHPAVEELVDEITDAVHQARRAVDRPADRKFFGTCYAETPDPEGRAVTCLEEIWASPSAQEVTCKVCGITHEIAERRAWLMRRAEDMIMTVPEASVYVGDVGHIKVTQASIRGYIHRKRLAYRAPVEAKRIRLGDLLAVVLDEGERKGAA